MMAYIPALLSRCEKKVINMKNRFVNKDANFNYFYIDFE